MIRRTCSGWRATSIPATDRRPAFGRISVATARMNVVFPAPLGPSTAVTCPLQASRSSPASASTLPNHLTSPSASMIGSVMSIPSIAVRSQAGPAPPPL